jgi:hypothetical protein
MKKLMMLAIAAGAFVAVQGASVTPASAFGWFGHGCKASCCTPCKPKKVAVRKCRKACGCWW